MRTAEHPLEDGEQQGVDERGGHDEAREERVQRDHDDEDQQHLRDHRRGWPDAAPLHKVRDGLDVTRDPGDERLHDGPRRPPRRTGGAGAGTWRPGSCASPSAAARTSRNIALHDANPAMTAAMTATASDEEHLVADECSTLECTVDQLLHRERVTSRCPAGPDDREAPWSGRTRASTPARPARHAGDRGTTERPFGGRRAGDGNRALTVRPSLRARQALAPPVPSAGASDRRPASRGLVRRCAASGTVRPRRACSSVA